MTNEVRLGLLYKLFPLPIPRLQSLESNSQNQRYRAWRFNVLKLSVENDVNKVAKQFHNTNNGRSEPLVHATNDQSWYGALQLVRAFGGVYLPRISSWRSKDKQTHEAGWQSWRESTGQWRKICINRNAYVHQFCNKSIIQPNNIMNSSWIDRWEKDKQTHEAAWQYWRGSTGQWRKICINRYANVHQFYNNSIIQLNHPS